MINTSSTTPLTLANAFRDDLSLAQIFDNLIAIGKQGLKDDKSMMTCAFLIMRNFTLNKYKVIAVPMANVYKGDMERNAYTLRAVVKSMRENKIAEYQLVAVARGSDAHMSVHDKDTVLNEKGELKDRETIQKAHKSTSRDVLIFEMEESFTKHTKVFEYIISDDGSVVISDEPFIDEKTLYDEIADKNSNFGFMFTRPMEEKS